MGLIIGLVVLAVIFGVLGLAISALKWLLVLALVLFVVSAVSGFTRRRSGV